jgi:diguanylate cyclase (GGDEF)-like protein
MNDDPTAYGARHHAGRTTTDRLADGSVQLQRPQRAERRLLRILLPLFAIAACTAWVVAELQDTAQWYERYVLAPSVVAFLLLLVRCLVIPARKVAQVRNCTLLVAPGIVIIGWGRQLADLGVRGFDPDVYFDMSPWVIFCAALFIFLLPHRHSWKFATGYYLFSLVMLGVFVALDHKKLLPMVVNEILLNNVIAPPVFIVLLSAFTRLRADYVRELTHADDMRELALLDGLTGLQNRRAFRQSFKRAKARQLRNKTPLCAMLLDIDHFKRINDTYGHQVGDEVLVKLANVLTRELRGTDEVFRWGGEEFMVLLEETPGKHLELVAERVRAAVEAEELLEKSKITISIGATHILPQEQDDVVYPRADEALYVSKRDGRNRVTIMDAAESARITPDFQP